MNREEMEREAGKIVLQLAEAKKIKVCLQSKLGNVLSVLGTAQQVLAGAREGTFADGKLSVEEGGATVHHTFLTADELGQLVADIEQANESVVNLEAMQAELVR